MLKSSKNIFDHKINLEHFDFKQFQQEAITKLKSGQPLAGAEGVMTPLIKQIIEAALEGEMDAHLSDCKEDGLANRQWKDKKDCQNRYRFIRTSYTS